MALVRSCSFLSKDEISSPDWNGNVAARGCSRDRNLKSSSYTRERKFVNHDWKTKSTRSIRSIGNSQNVIVEKESLIMLDPGVNH